MFSGLVSLIVTADVSQAELETRTISDAYYASQTSTKYLVTYDVSTRGDVTGNLTDFKKIIADTFADNRGWVRAGIIELVEAAKKYNMSCVGVIPVPGKRISRYGVVAGEEVEPGVVRVRRLVEKPPAEEAPSNLGIVGRYLLTPEIFTYIEETKPGHGGEIQLTDALQRMADERGLMAITLHGQRFDAGDWCEYLLANIHYGLKDESLRNELLQGLKAMLNNY